ncbi:hypothetical protein B4U78_015895 [Microbacterium esteraromaticum]|nr:hypothetical protein B4U78_015895 [Microbacterium esteraromaticum]
MIGIVTTNLFLKIQYLLSNGSNERRILSLNSLCFKFQTIDFFSICINFLFESGFLISKLLGLFFEIRKIV